MVGSNARYWKISCLQVRLARSCWAMGPLDLQYFYYFRLQLPLSLSFKCLRADLEELQPRANDLYLWRAIEKTTPHQLESFASCQRHLRRLKGSQRFVETILSCPLTSSGTNDALDGGKSHCESCHLASIRTHLYLALNCNSNGDGCENWHLCHRHQTSTTFWFTHVSLSCSHWSNCQEFACCC